MKKNTLSSATKTTLIYAAIVVFWILSIEAAIFVLRANPSILSIMRIGLYCLVIATTYFFIFQAVKKTQSTTELGDQARYTQLFESANEGIFRSSPDGRYIKVNPAMASIYGFSSPQEMIDSITNISEQIYLSLENRQRFVTALNDQGSVEKFEAPNFRKDGSVIWTSTNARAIKDDNGKILYYEGFITDITKQKSAEAALSKAEVLYRTLVEQMPAAAYTDSPDNFANFFTGPQILAISGYSAEEWKNDANLWLRLVHPEDKLRVQEENERSLDSGEPFNIEYRLITRNGEIVWVHDIATLIRNADGSPQYWQGLLIDITRQKNADESTRLNEARYRMLVEQASDGIFITNGQGKLLDANQQACKMLGYTQDELLSRNLQEIMSKEELALKPLNLHGVSAGKIVVSERVLSQKDNGFITVELSIKMLPDKSLIIIARDISGRKLIREALSRSQQRFKSLIENSTDGIALYSPDGKILFQSSSATRILGYSLNEMIEKNILEFILEEDRPSVREGLKKISETPGLTLTQEVRYIHKSSQAIWLEVINSNHLSDEGIEAIVSNYRDITERKHTETVMRETEERYRLLVEKLPAVVFMDIFNDSKSTQYISPRMKDLLGYTPEEWENGDNLWETSLHPDDYERVIDEDNRTNLTGEPFRIEYRLRHRNGHYIWIKEDATIVRNQDGEPIYWQGILLDISEQKKAEEALQHQLIELTVLHSATLAESTAQDVDELIQQITDVIGDSLYADSYGVLLINEEGNVLKPHSSYRVAGQENLPLSLPVTQGVSGMVISTGKSFRTGDITNEPKYFPAINESRSKLCVPITSKKEVIGVINLESAKINAFTEMDERILNTVASGLANAIQRIRLFTIEQKRHKQTEILREATASLTKSLNIQAIYEIMLEASFGLVKYTSASIEMINGDYLEIVAQHGLPEGYSYVGNTYVLNREKWGGDIWKPLILANVQEDKRFIKLPGTEYIRGWMGIPLIANENIVGFLNFDSEMENFFTKDDAGILQTFANQAAVAIENARLFEQETRRTQIIEAMADIANETATTHEISPILNKIAHRALDLLMASNVAVYLLQDDNSTLKIITAEGIYSKELLSHSLKLGVGITGQIVLNGRPEIIGDTIKDPRRATVPGTPEDDGKRETMMSAPLILRGKCIGAINAWRPLAEGVFNQMELSFLISIAHQASIAIESGRLFSETIRGAQEAAAIAEVGRNISSTLQLDVVLERIAEYAKDLLNVETSAVYLSESTNSTLDAIAAIGEFAEEIKNDPLKIGDGILGSIAAKGMGEIVNNTLDDPRTVIIKGTPPEEFEHIMGVPVISKDQLTGLLVVWRKGKGLEFKSTDLNFLNRLGQQAAIAIENARLYTETRQRLEELEVVSRVSFALRAARDTNDMYPILLNEIKTNIKTETAGVWIYDADGDEIVPQAVSGWLSKMPKKYFKPNEGILGQVFTTGTAHISENLQTDPLAHPDNKDFFDDNWSSITVPIRTASETIGAILVAISSPQQIGTHHIRLITTIAEIAGNAIYRSNLYEQSDEQIRRLTTLREIDAAISSSLDLSITLNILTEHLITKMDAGAADVLVFNPESQLLDYLAVSGFQNRDATQSSITIADSIVEHILLSRNSLYIKDLTSENNTRIKNIVSKENFVSYYATPLFSKGAVRGILETYFRSPFTPSNDWLDFIQTLAGQATIAIDNSQLFQSLQRTNQELSLAYDTTLEGWGKALELRDKETQGHTRRVTELTLKLAQKIGIPQAELTHIRRGVLLHDIGKMGVPDNILRKEGPLTGKELAEMRKHPQYAYDLLYPITYLRPAADIAYSHHEWWNGEGYPRKLKGDEIPLPARIFAIVDVWDALLSDRPYRKAWPKKKVIKYIKDLSGKQFDPHIVEIFMAMMDENKPPQLKAAKKKK